MIQAGRAGRRLLLPRAEPFGILHPLQQAAKLLFALSDDSTIPFWQEATRHSDDIVSLWARAALCKLNQAPDENLRQIALVLREADRAFPAPGRSDIMKALADKRCIPS